MAGRARSVQRPRGKRALGARLARWRGGRRSSWTRRHGVGLTEGVATARGWRRWRRPWRGSARERGVGGEWRCPGGSRRGMEFIHPATRRGGEAGRRPAAWRTLRSPSGTCLPAWPASSSLERRWAGPAGGPGAGRQVSFFHFLSVFCFFNTSATLLN